MLLCCYPDMRLYYNVAIVSIIKYWIIKSNNSKL